MKSYVRIWAVLFSLVLIAQSCSKGFSPVKETHWTVNGKEFLSSIAAGMISQAKNGQMIWAESKKKESVIIIGFQGDLRTGVFDVANLSAQFDGESSDEIEDEITSGAIEIGENECIILIVDKDLDEAYFTLLEDAGQVHVTKKGSRYVASFKDVKLALLSLELKEVTVSGQIAQKF